MRSRWLAVAALVALASTACGQQPSAEPASGGSPAGSGSASASASPTPPPPSEPLRAGETFATIGVADGLPGGVYEPKAPRGGTDDYRCFLADPQLAADSFITGVGFLPGNPAVVHHSILFRVDPAQVAAAEAKDAEDPRPGWECFGGPDLPSTSKNPIDALDAAPWLAAWAPGGKENVFADGFGVPLAAGGRVVIQMHYNLLAAGDSPLQDATQVRLRMSGDTALTPLRTTLLPAPVELPCAPGESGALCNRGDAVLDVMSRFGEGTGRTIAGLQLLCGGDLVNPQAGPTQSCTRVVREPMTIRSAAGHMHLLGRSIRIEANAGTPRARTILDIPVWDFDDQGARPLDTPVSVVAGDRITVTCTHDATLRAQLPALKDTPPRYVVWGEGTSDEMCLGILIVTD